MFRAFAINFISVLATFTLQSAHAVSTSAEFNPDEIVGFEIIMAGNCDHGVECAMGHTLLRVVRREGHARLDPVLSFTTSDERPASVAGIIGFSFRALTGLNLAPSNVPLHLVHRVYVVEEKRTMSRIPLQTTATVKARMLQNIAKLFSSAAETSPQEKNTAYNYLFANCAGLLVDFLKDAGMPYEFFGIAIPANLPAHLFRTYSALYPEIETRSNVDFEENFGRLPEAMYQFCQDVVCARSVLATFQSKWPREQIEFPKFEKPDRDFERETLRTRSQPTSWNGLKETVIKHFELLRTTR